MATTWRDNSDLVGRFKALDAASVSVAAPVIPPPSNVEQRLQELGLSWSQLSSAAMHAVLWDTGVVVGSVASVDTYLQVYVPCGVSMSGIFISKDEFTTLQPTTDCSGPGGTKYARQQGAIASFALLDRFTKCAIADAQLASANTTSASYSQDALQTFDVPSVRLLLHRDESGATRPVIHTFVDPVLSSTSASCPLVSQSVGLTIPCESRLNQPANSINKCLPTPSSAMTAWLSSIKSSSASTSASDTASADGLSTPAIGVIAGGCAAVVVLVLGMCFYRRWKGSQQLHAQLQSGPYNPMPPTTNHSISNVQIGDAVPPNCTSRNAPDAALSSLHKATSVHRPSHLSSLAMNPFHESSHAVDTFDPSNALAKLDQIPAHLRLPFASISRTQLLASGVRSEVYYGRYNHKLVVAVKVITPDKVHDQENIEAFAEEIRLMAMFRHPNIVALVGYAWDTSLGSLTAVTEYLSQGNLSRFLTETPGLHWDLKASLALDVARALQYLHGLLQPMVIHRDLKSTNILLDWPNAKLSGFGVSRQAMEDETMTAGVGSAFYMAPEALRSGYYSVSADMYSFGCVLCELDTQQPLYANVAVPNKRIMYFILEEGLVPSVSATCPPAIRALAEQCFDPDPSLRPTAFDVARDLDAFVNGKGDNGGGLV